MRDFDLGRQFDAVTCLFSAIGFVGGPEGLSAAGRSLATHLAPGGVLIVEPWLKPDVWRPNTRHLLTHDDENVTLARLTMSGIRDERVSTMAMHYLVGTPDGTDYFVEQLDAYLFTDDEMRAGLEDAGLTVEHDPEGLGGRGLWFGTH